MFKDYYAILVISHDATSEEIKSAFKKQALKWHPDINPDIDSTSKMQAIIEAKLILLDPEARLKYDIEYNRYQSEKRKKGQEQYQQEESQKNEHHQSAEKERDEFGDSDYQIYDEELYRWMNNAKMQSVDLAKKTIEDFKGMVKAGTKAAAKEAASVITVQIVLGVIILFFFLLSRACG
jgi:curved DNA-binding protein CbpA